MKKIREVLRLRFDAKLSIQKIAGALKLSKGGVHKCLVRFDKSDLEWPVPKGLSDLTLNQKLYGMPKMNLHFKDKVPDWNFIHMEMQRPHVTLQILWEEYIKQFVDGMGRTSFYRHYNTYKDSTKKPDMKGIYKGGDKLFLDFSGDGLKYIDLSTGEEIALELFCASWGASSYSFADVVPSQNNEDWVLCNKRCLDFFGCVPAALVPDNLKSAVKVANFYDPILNPLYLKLAEHYDTVVLPARARTPKDKATVESNVLHIQRHILARLRDRSFYSILEVRDAVLEELKKFNDRPMKDYGGMSRSERFLKLDKPNAKPLPGDEFQICKIKEGVRAAPNYHVEFEKHFYSVPHNIARKKVDVHQVGNLIEIYHQGLHLCRHKKSNLAYGYSTVDAHMPENHKFVKGWSSSYFIFKAGEIGPSTSEVVKTILDRLKHPEQGFRSALGVLSLAKQYGAERLEKASARALHYNSTCYRSLKSILEKNLDQIEIQPSVENIETHILHDNIRGSEFYKTESTERNNQCI